jgi:hypothetical protein
MQGLLSGFWITIAAAIVLCLPGITWLSWGADPHKDLIEQLADAVGLSIALTSLAALGLFLAGLSLPGTAVILIFGLLALAAILGQARKARTGGRRLRAMAISLRVILGLGLIAVLGWRFYQARELVLPAWVDSVHHALIVRVLLESGGVPATLDPYLPVPFYYHYAFHVLAAVFSFIARLQPEQGVFILGQMINAAVTLSIYRLAMAMWGDWRRGFLAVLLVGFVSHMPSYYVTWGRYTLLTGLVLLPLAMALSVEIAYRGPTRLRLAKLAVFVSGLLLAHYFAGLLLALFLVLLGLQILFRAWRRGRLRRERQLLFLAVAALAGALLAAPWVFRAWFFTQGSLEFGPALLTNAAVDDQYFPDYLQYLWHLLGPDLSRVLLFLSPPGLVVALLRKRSRAFALWAVGLALLCLPWGPYLSPFRPDHAVIVMFLPVTLLVAAFFVALIDGSFSLGRRLESKRLAWAGFLAVLISVGGLLTWGLKETGSIVNPQTILAGPADLRALHWIEANTPQQARFFINVTHWQYGLYRGVDGGWWIMPLTGRETLLPPALYSAGPPDYVRQINSRAETASKLEGCQPEFWELIQDSGTTHLYIGQKFGPLRPEGLEGCPKVQQVYAQEGVYVYEIEDE